ncbi:MAG: hypothetical protein LBD48_11430 [Treponema sp.]|jgi:hypothetical protein|nr:hypothetical protein [Treponema sp.]
MAGSGRRTNGWITGSDVPLLGEVIPGTESPPAEDIALSDTLREAYKQRMAGSPVYRGNLPVYIMRYYIPGRSVPGSLSLAAVARVAGKDSLTPGSSGWGYGTLGSNMNRGMLAQDVGAFLTLTFAAP